MRSPIKLTRELKITLTLLAFAGGVGGFYVYNLGNTPESAAPTSMSATAPVTEAPSEAPTASGDETPRVNVTAPARPVQVEQIPFLTTETPEPTEATAEVTRVAVAASGALPNPFQPLRLEVTEPVPSAEAALPTTLPVPSVPAPTPSAPPQVVASAPLPVPPIPGTVTSSPNVSTTDRVRQLGGGFSGGAASAVTLRPGGVVSVTPPRVTGAAPLPTPTALAPLPVPSLPSGPAIPVQRPSSASSGTASGGNASASPAPRTPTPTVPAPTTPPTIGNPTPLPTFPAVPTPVTPPTTPPTTASASRPTPPVSAPAVRVPAPTVRAPATATVPTLPGGPGRAETPASATNPAVPPVVTQLEAAATEGAPTEPTDPVTPTEPSADPVEAFVAAQGVSYSAVVLGPVNTGILQTRTGYLVVTVGQKLLDSEVVVKDITATNVVLAIGNQQKTLELDKR